MQKGRPRYPDAFRSEVIDLVRAGQRSLPHVVCGLGINDQTLRNWVAHAESDAGRGAPGALTNKERAELVRLRRGSHILQHEKEILARAAAHFATKTL